MWQFWKTGCLNRYIEKYLDRCVGNVTGMLLQGIQTYADSEKYCDRCDGNVTGMLLQGVQTHTDSET